VGITWVVPTKSSPCTSPRAAAPGRIREISPVVPDRRGVTTSRPAPPLAPRSEQRSDSADTPPAIEHVHAAHAHGHGELPLAPEQRRRVRTVLAAIVIPLLLLTIVGLVALWPRGESPVASIPLLADGMSIETARVVNLGDPAAGVEVRAELLTGSRPGQVINVHVPEEVTAH